MTRIDDYLLAKGLCRSRTDVNTLVRNRNLAVNGEDVRSAFMHVDTGDIVRHKGFAYRVGSGDQHLAWNSTRGLNEFSRRIRVAVSVLLHG